VFTCIWAALMSVVCICIVFVPYYFITSYWLFDIVVNCEMRIFSYFARSSSKYTLIFHHSLEDPQPVEIIEHCHPLHAVLHPTKCDIIVGTYSTYAKSIQVPANVQNFFKTSVVITSLFIHNPYLLANR